MKTSELTGAALDWAVAKCEKHDVFTRPIANAQHKFWVGIITHDYQMSREGPFTPSTDWSQGGPIIEREWIDLHCVNDSLCEAECPANGGLTMQNGPTPLIAAMRCYVASKIGDDVEVPEELKS